jgi:hypothetical protein
VNAQKIITIVLIAALILFSVAGAVFVLWANAASAPTPNALTALASDEFVQFSNENGWLVWQPVNQSVMASAVDTGLIIYPGGRVDFRAYAPLARAIAEQGYLVVIVPAPLNLAFFDVNAAQRVIDTNPQIEHWVVAGHSLGGVAASSFAAANPNKVGGIAFWASYPAGDMDTFPGKVVSIYGTHDGLASPSQVAASKSNLPATTKYIAIDGGNHAQFGDYGPQQGDNPAAISHSEQQAQIASATVELLRGLAQ